MKVIVGIIASKDPIYNLFKDVWIKCINYIKSQDKSINYDFYFIYSEEIKSESDNLYTLDIYKNYVDYYYKYKPFETDNIKREVIVLNKIIDFYKYITIKLNLGDNDNYIYNTDSNTTYILRTNLSSCFDFEMLYTYLLDKPKKNFFAGTINGYYNNIYTTISGMNSILSLDLIMYCVNNHSNIMDYLNVLKYEDDTISNFIIKNLNVYLINIKRLDFIEMEKVILPTHVWPATPRSIIYQKCQKSDHLLFSFRFKTFNRTNDIEIMNILNDNIIKGFNLSDFVILMSKSYGYLINTESEEYGDLYSENPFKIN